MLALQILVTAFALFALSRAYVRLRASDISSREFMFWSLVWVCLVITVYIPSLSTFVATALGLASGSNLLVYIGIIVLFYLVFRLYVKIEDLEHQITKLVRHIAMERPGKKKR
ncbi:MAG: DUF2304 family protein [Nanoarchaeota archaeon]